MEKSKITENDLDENATRALPDGQCPNPPESAEELAEDKSPNANQDGLLDRLQTVQTGIENLEQELKTIAESSGKTTSEIREMHKLYHNEFANRLKSMQEELDRYHEMEKGRVFDGILGELAGLYSVNESVVEEITDDKAKKRIRYMFEDILQILGANGVSRQKSNVGDKRNTRHCQVVERIPAEDPALHDTVALSRGTGFYVENRSLVKELVDIYLFEDANADNPAEK
jgi:molecular chaperone GrpE (heat shock protein)